MGVTDFCQSLIKELKHLTVLSGTSKSVKKEKIRRILLILTAY